MCPSASDAPGTRLPIKSLETPSRRYVSTRRTRQAEQTKAEIVSAATELFLRDGWRGTTIAAVAARAGVVVDTIYTGFGSKAGLLVAAKDAARDADEAGVPFSEWPTLREALQGEPDERVNQIATLLATLNARTWKLDVVWRDAAAYEPSVRRQWTERELGLTHEQYTAWLTKTLSADNWRLDHSRRLP